MRICRFLLVGPFDKDPDDDIPFHGFEDPEE
jgi:hypothetical protein